MMIRNLQKILVLSLVLFLMNCSHEKRNENSIPRTKAPSNKPNKATTKITAQHWFDSVMIIYNKTTRNPLARSAIKDSSIKEEWIFDQNVKTDTGNYFVYQVGHDFSDNDGLRFVTDGCIYVDTVKRKLYEYQPDGKLLSWKAEQH